MTSDLTPRIAGELRSWAEIARHLGVGVRTAQRWASELGLPVRRANGGRTVSADPAELDRWWQSRSPGPGLVQKPESQLQRAVSPVRNILSGRWGFGALLLVAATVLGAGGLLWNSGLVGERPKAARLQLTADRLEALDAKGRVLWDWSGFRNEIPEPISVLESRIHMVESEGRQHAILADMPTAYRSRLYCIDPPGRLRWELPLGRESLWGARRLNDQFSPGLVRPVKLGAEWKVLVVAIHYPWFPTRVILVDPETGEIESEYWHPGNVGHSVHFLLHDLDDDGDPELILGGINNPGPGAGHPALIQLDLPFRPPREGPVEWGGGERRYLLFPRPEVGAGHGELYLATPTVAHEKGLEVRISSMLGGVGTYRLDSEWRLLELIVSDDYRRRHDEEWREGRLDHPFGPTDVSALSKVLSFSSAPDGNDPRLRDLWAQQVTD